MELLLSEFFRQLPNFLQKLKPIVACCKLKYIFIKIERLKSIDYG